jgi:hypothetical protein
MERDFSIPKENVEKKKEEEEVKTRVVTKEESIEIEKVFFEDDELVRLRDGVSYRIPPLALRDARKLMKSINTIDTSVIIANLIADEEGNDSYDNLLEVISMAFKPYYKSITLDYLSEYVDLACAKQIIDIMIGLNGLKKSM